jgi:hypothetical protein
MPSQVLNSIPLLVGFNFMILILIVLATIGTLVLAERSAEHLRFAIAAFCFSAAVFLLIVTDLDRAMLLACVLATAITAASTIKYNHSALKLVVTDLPLLFAGTVPFFIAQYPRAVLAAVAGTAALVSAAIAVLIYGTGPPLAPEVRIFLSGLALPAYHGPAALLLLHLHGLADRPAFLVAIQRFGSERYCR